MNKKKKNKKIILVLLSFGLLLIGSKTSATKVTFKSHTTLSSIVNKFKELKIDLDQTKLLAFLDQLNISHNKIKITQKFMVNFDEATGKITVNNSHQIFKLVDQQLVAETKPKKPQYEFAQAIINDDAKTINDLIERHLVDLDQPLELSCIKRVIADQPNASKLNFDDSMKKVLPLSLATALGKLTALKTLLDHNANLYLQDRCPNGKFQQPIFWYDSDHKSPATKLKILQLYFDHKGFNPNLVSDNGKNILITVLTMEDSSRILDFVFSSPKVDYQYSDPNYGTLFTNLIRLDFDSGEKKEQFKLNLIKKLVKYKFDVNMKIDLLTPAVIALDQGYFEIFKFLVNHPDFQSKENISLELAYAIYNKNSAAIDELIKVNHLGRGIRVFVMIDDLDYARQVFGEDSKTTLALKEEFKQQHLELFLQDNLEDLESATEKIVNLPEEDKLKAIDQEIAKVDEEEQAEISESSSASDQEDSNEATEVVVESSGEDLVKKDQVTDVENNVSSPTSPSLEELEQRRLAKKLARQQRVALKNGFNRTNLEQQIKAQFDQSVERNKYFKDNKLIKSERNSSVKIDLHVNDLIFADPNHHHLNPISYAHTCFDIIKEYVQINNLHNVMVHAITGWGAHAESHHSLTQDALLQLAKKYRIQSMINPDNAGDVVLKF